MKTKTHVKAGNSPVGSTGTNHNETLVRDAERPKGLTVKTRVKAGDISIGSTGTNHNETLVADTPRKRYRTPQRRRVPCSCPRES